MARKISQMFANALIIVLACAGILFGILLAMSEPRTPTESLVDRVDHAATVLTHTTCAWRAANESDALCANAIDDDCDGHTDRRDQGCGTPLASNFVPLFDVEADCTLISLMDNDNQPIDAGCRQYGGRIACTNISIARRLTPRMICRNR